MVENSREPADGPPPPAAWLCHVNAGSRAEALRIGRAVVEERLAASANVLGGLSSCYWWQGRLEEAAEALLILKTRAELVPTLIARVRQLHSYQCPAVIALPIAAGNPDYLRWIAAETRFSDFAAPRRAPYSSSSNSRSANRSRGNSSSSSAIVGGRLGIESRCSTKVVWGSSATSQVLAG